MLIDEVQSGHIALQCALIVEAQVCKVFSDLCRMMQLFARAGKANCVEVPPPAKGQSGQSAQSEGSATFKSPVRGSGLQVSRHCLYMVPETHPFIIRTRFTLFMLHVMGRNLNLKLSVLSALRHIP